jgi:Spy/CpxP family protein refolding chaperone
MGLQKRVVILAFGLLLTTSSSVVAYEPQTASPQQPETVEPQNGQRGGRRSRMYDKRFGFGLRGLDLTAEQKQQMQVILQRHLENIRGQRQELFQLREKRITGTLTAEDQERAKSLHAQLSEARQGIRSELNNVLTAEQRTQLEQIESQRKAKREERMKRRQELRNRIPQ